MSEYNVLQERIDKINKLLDRLDQLPKELDEIHEQLFHPFGLNRDEYAALADRRNALLIEQERVEREIKEVYHMRVD